MDMPMEEARAEYIAECEEKAKDNLRQIMETVYGSDQPFESAVDVVADLLLVWGEDDFREILERARMHACAELQGQR